MDAGTVCQGQQWFGQRKGGVCDISYGGSNGHCKGIRLNVARSPRRQGELPALPAVRVHALLPQIAPAYFELELLEVK